MNCYRGCRCSYVLMFSGSHVLMFSCFHVFRMSRCQMYLVSLGFRDLSQWFSNNCVVARQNGEVSAGVNCFSRASMPVRTTRAGGSFVLSWFLRNFLSRKGCKRNSMRKRSFFGSSRQVGMNRNINLLGTTSPNGGSRPFSEIKNPQPKLWVSFIINHL